MTAREYRLLTAMVENAEKLLTHRQILSEVCGPACVSHDDYVRMHMGNLPSKLRRGRSIY